MRVQLRGIHSVRKRLSSGVMTIYNYAWRGGPRLEGKVGSPEFVNSYNSAVATRQALPAGTLVSLIAKYRGSADYK